MAGRDDFPEAAKRQLAKRVGYRCSAPFCRLVTVGPSDDRASGATVIGVAAHMTAAAAGGPRYNGKLSEAERSSPDNGIWLCQNHAKAIDDDVARFPEGLLRQWRDRAERLARAELLSGDARSQKRLLIEHVTDLRLETGQALHSAVAQFMADVGATEAWGETDAEYARLALYELALNASTHGGADAIRISSSANTVCLTHSHRGESFGLEDLLASNGQGGRTAVERFREGLGGALELTHRDLGQVSEWCVVDIVAEGVDRPCGISMNDLRRHPEQARLRLSGCDEVHLYVPGLWSYSDAHLLHRLLSAFEKDHVWVIHGLAVEGPVGDFLSTLMPGVVIR